MSHSFVVTDSVGNKHSVKAKSYVEAAKIDLNEGEQTSVLVQGKTAEKEFKISKKDGEVKVSQLGEGWKQEIKSQSGNGWNQVIQSQTGSSVLRTPKIKQTKVKNIQYTGKNKKVKGKTHKEAVHYMLGNGFIPEDLQLPDNLM